MQNYECIESLLDEISFLSFHDLFVTMVHRQKYCNTNIFFNKFLIFVDSSVSLCIDIESMHVCGAGFGQCKNRKIQQLAIGIRQQLFKGNQFFAAAIVVDVLIVMSIFVV